MGWQNRLPNPFPASARAERAFWAAVYLQMPPCDMLSDSETGDFTMKIDKEDEPSGVSFTGSAGEVLTHKGFYVPNLDTSPASLIDLGFMMGYLQATHEARKNG